MSSSANMWGAGLAQGERDRAMSYLHATRKQFLDTVTPLSGAQWMFKPAGGGWSIAEIAEHLLLTEESVMTGIARALKETATPEQKAATAGKDDIIMKAVPDRSRKVLAPETVAPAGRYQSRREDAAAEFRAARDRTIGFIEKTSEDLRAHTFPHPFLKELDCYQWTLMVAAHADRHIQQMKEVISSPGFPAK